MKAAAGSIGELAAEADLGNPAAGRTTVRTMPLSTCPQPGANVEPNETPEPKEPRVVLLWFRDCPNHHVARIMLRELLSELAPGAMINDVDATEAAIAERHRFPGSPTIRVDGRDVDPSFRDPGDYTPRCRLYWTAEGLRGVPERAWVEAALRASIERRHRPAR